MGGWKLNLGPLAEQPMLLAAEPSLQAQNPKDPWIFLSLTLLLPVFFVCILGHPKPQFQSGSVIANKYSPQQSSVIWEVIGLSGLHKPCLNKTKRAKKPPPPNKHYQPTHLLNQQATVFHWCGCIFESPGDSIQCPLPQILESWYGRPIEIYALES